MDSKPNKRKSINLFLLIFIVLALTSLIILTVYFLNNSEDDNVPTKNTSNIENFSSELNENTNTNANTNNTNQTETNTLQNNNSTFNSIENFGDFEDINTNETTTQNSSQTKNLTLNDHTLTFDNSVDASIVQNSNASELQINYPDFNLKMLFGTNKSTTFESLKTNTSLRSHLESTYNITVTSALKSGNLNDLDVIICTISDTTGQAYFIITPLSDSEILYSKVYNTSNTQTLIEDLSKPLDEISSIISKLQN
ncbi:MAG: hypothetical protein J6A89_00665 [Clostridia bacterium]|nr:hypothetical protein [Clostridia bacterium]